LLRSAAFEYLNRLIAQSRGTVTTAELRAFEFEGRRISLLQHMRGIRTVVGLEAALSIRTTYAARPEDRPYDDGTGPDGYQRYMWQGVDPNAHDNVALRRAVALGKPLMWLFGVAPGEFAPIYPNWLVGEEPEERRFVVALDVGMREQWTPELLEHPADLALRRRYAEAVVRQRLHQRVFRERVMVAYEGQCALCSLRHRELLDAAHIKEDADGGEPIVTNGISMCLIHHGAFDTQVLGIRPDYVVQIRGDVLKELDGPTHRHALQGLHGEGMWLPRKRAARPDATLLEERWERFRAAS